MKDKEIHIVYHMFCDTEKYCLDLFKETTQCVKKSDLYESLSCLHVNFTGNVCEDITSNELFKDDKIKLTNICENSTGEMDTLKLLWDLNVIHPNSVFLYLHSKGVSRKGNKNVDCWRKYMEYFNIGMWRDCIKQLSTYDTCGVNLQFDPGKCYAGNYWWANGDYIKKLPRFDIKNCSVPYCFGNPRSYCEFWLLDNKFCNPTTLHNSNIDHYGVEYTESYYIK